MCLAVPGRVEELVRDGDVPMARVSFSGVVRSVCVAHVPEAAVGDYVLVHVGFALSRIDEQEARRTLALLAELGELEGAMAGHPDGSVHEPPPPPPGKERAA